MDTLIASPNRQHILGILQNMLELYEFELESYFHMYKVCQLIEAINHFHKFTVATGGLN